MTKTTNLDLSERARLAYEDAKRITEAEDRRRMEAEDAQRRKEAVEVACRLLEAEPHEVEVSELGTRITVEGLTFEVASDRTYDNGVKHLRLLALCPTCNREVRRGDRIGNRYLSSTGAPAGGLVALGAALDAEIVCYHGADED